jgi:hypothetical protein
MEDVDWSELLNSFDDLADDVKDAFASLFGDIDVSTPEGLTKVIQTVIDSVKGLVNVTSGMIESWKPFLSGIGSAAAEFLELSDGAQKATGNVLGGDQVVKKVAGVFKIFATVLSTVGKAFVMIAGTSVASAILKAGTAASTAGAGFGAMGTGIAATIGSAATKAGLLGLAIAIEPFVHSVNQSVLGALDNATRKTIDWAKELVGLGSAQKTQGELLEDAAADMVKYGEAIDAVPTEKTTEIKPLSYDEALKMVQDARVGINDIPDKKTTALEVSADTNKIKDTAKLVTEILPDGHIVITETKANAQSLTDTKEKIDKEIPAEKLLEIQAQIDTERLKAQAAIIQTSIEWEAKVDVAELESTAKMIEAAFESVGQTIDSTGETISSLFGDYGAIDDTFKQNYIESAIRQEQANRTRALDMQESLTQAQVDYLNSQSRAVKNGTAAITVKADGLKPHLEAILWELFAALQVRINADKANYLVGVGSS